MNGRLVYDVGAHMGEDTAAYLALGYRVLAIEADPALCERLRARFSSEIAAGRCQVENVGIAEHDGEAPFYLCNEVPAWNSFDPSWAMKHGATTRQINVPCRRFQSILAEQGMPYLLKVDIEGLDHLCINALQKGELPRFVSFEADEASADPVLKLIELGFEEFRLVDQNTHGFVDLPQPGSVGAIAWQARQLVRRRLRQAPRLHKALVGLKHLVKPTAGPPSENPATDLIGATVAPTDGEIGWQSRQTFPWLWHNVVHSGYLGSSWFDIHARRAG